MCDGARSISPHNKIVSILESCGNSRRVLAQSTERLLIFIITFFVFVLILTYGPYWIEYIVIIFKKQNLIIVLIIAIFPTILPHLRIRFSFFKYI